MTKQMITDVARSQAVRCSNPSLKGEKVMHRVNKLVMVMALAVPTIATVAFAQQSSRGMSDSAASPSTIRGCLRGQRGNYVVTEDRSGTVYVLKGVGNKLDKFRRNEVEVKGMVVPGTVKTGVNPNKAGDNPSDSVRGVDGVVFQVADVDADVRSISKQCKAADAQ